MNQLLAVILAALIACPPAFSQQSNENLKSKVLEIPTGSIVEVRLLDNTRLRGRLGAVSDTGFELQVNERNKIETRQIGFDRVKSIRDTGRKSFGHSLGKGFLIAGIAIAGILGAFVLIVCATHGCSG